MKDATHWLTHIKHLISLLVGEEVSTFSPKLEKARCVPGHAYTVTQGWARSVIPIEWSWYDLEMAFWIACWGMTRWGMTQIWSSLGNGTHCPYCNVFSNWSMGATWVAITGSVFPNVHGWAPPRSIDLARPGWGWAENWHRWSSLGPEPDRINQVKAGWEEWGEETPGKWCSWTSLWEPSPTPSSVNLCHWISKGRVQPMFCMFVFPHWRESWRILSNRAFQAFPWYPWVIPIIIIKHYI